MLINGAITKIKNKIILPQKTDKNYNILVEKHKIIITQYITNFLLYYLACYFSSSKVTYRI